MHGLNRVKIIALLLWIAPSMVLFYILNKVANDSYFAFVTTIFGCNLVYDVSKKMANSPTVDFETWRKVGSKYGLAILLFIISIVGLYIEAMEYSLSYIGAILVSLPAYLASIYYFSVTEDVFKESIVVDQGN
ncbi:hypothetical protein MJO52_05785 [Microbulbifer variabilis]|uniref:Uncharacterized protein n=1 Tax=Microbulbifer variabilis TaxID=266805 RepID=A0ABY4VHK6_9GAMM|nr:hypothetical protein [Microbulbifer variabilis]USD22643.1 hypothetical protein MJO52_05785 [Microbulbifer variabilis]